MQVIFPSVSVQWSNTYENVPDFFNVKKFNGEQLDVEGTIKLRQEKKLEWFKTNYFVIQNNENLATGQEVFDYKLDLAKNKSFTFDGTDNSVIMEYDQDLEEVNYLLVVEEENEKQVIKYYFIYDLQYIDNTNVKIFLVEDIIFSNVEYLDLMLTSEVIAERGHLDRYTSFEGEKVFNWTKDSYLTKKEPFLDAYIPQVNNPIDLEGAPVSYVNAGQQSPAGKLISDGWADQGAVLMFVNTSKFKLKAEAIKNKADANNFSQFIEQVQIFNRPESINHGFGLKFDQLKANQNYDNSTNSEVANLPYTILVLPFNSQIKDNQGEDVLDYSNYWELVNSEVLKDAIINVTVVPYFTYEAESRYQSEV